MAIVTELSENLAVNEECCTITDKDKNVVFSFDFDAIGDTFTGAHYVVNYNEPTESTSGAASETASDFPESSQSSNSDESISPTTETLPIKPQETTFEEFFSDAEVSDVSLEEAIAQSNCVVRAKCLSYKDFDEYTDYCFSLVDTYKGKVDDTFYVRWSTYDSTKDTIPFSVKEEYIMPLTYVNSVYFDYPVYNVYAHMTMLCNNDNIASVSVGDAVIKPDKCEVKIDSFASYVASIPDTSATMFEDYITSTALNDVISQYDYIVKAKITGEPNKTGSDRGIYPCEITQRFKGDISDSFEAVFMYDSVEVGNEYYFFLTKPDETSRFYIISSKNSIYDANNDAVLKALENSGII